MIKRAFEIAFRVIKDPPKVLERLASETVPRSVMFVLLVGAVTSALTPLQVWLGFEDVNSLHAGGQAEVLAMMLLNYCGLSVWWRPLLIETFYVAILFITSAYMHAILKILGGRGTARDTAKMIAYGDAPGLLFGWIPYFATVAALWAAAIQLLLGPAIVHKLPWGKAAVLFAALVGLGFIDIVLSR
nr:YIP1 family protein [Candidatus Sigynarchaeum springense]